MKRVLLLMLLAECAGILLSHYLKIRFGQLCMICTAAFLLLQRCRAAVSDKARRAMLLCVLLFFLGGLRMLRFEAFRPAAPQQCGRVCRFTGTVLRYKAYDGRFDLIVHIDAVIPRDGDPIPADECVLASWKSDDRALAADLVGRRIGLAGEVSIPTGRRNRGCFDYSAYLASQEIFALVKLNPYRLELLSVPRPLLHILSVYKEAFRRYASGFLAEEDLALLCALMFGDKSLLDEDVYEEFRMGGIAHILAVSGLHVSLVYEAVQKLLKDRRDGFVTAVSAVLLWAYAALADYSVSVMRAVWMIYLRMAAFYLHRRYDSLCAVCAVLGAMLLADPYRIFDSGLQLSFAAACSMGVALPWAQLKVIQISDRKKSDLLYRAGSLMAPCVMVQLGMLPLTVFHFLSVSPASWILNPPAAAAAALLLPLGLILFLLFIIMQMVIAPIISMVGKFSFVCICNPVEILCSLIRRFSAAAADSFLAGRYVCAPALGSLILYYFLFYFGFSDSFYMLCRRGKKDALALIFCFFAAAGCLLPKALDLSDTAVPWRHDTRAVSFLDVGQGDCIHLQIGGKNVLIDGGGSFYSDIAEDTLRPYLLKNGVDRVDLAVVTHMDGDHSRGIAQLSALMPIGTMVFPAGSEVSDLSDFCCSDRSFLSAGDRIVLAEDTALRVLSPGSVPASDENEASLVLMLEYRDLKVLLTADAGFETEDRLLSVCGAQGLSCDILKVAHHGSAHSTGERFLDAAEPSFAVISVGAGNSYGHPAARVIDLLQESDIIYARTDECGAICLRSIEDGTLRFENAAKDRNWLIRRTTR